MAGYAADLVTPLSCSRPCAGAEEYTSMPSKSKRRRLRDRRTHILRAFENTRALHLFLDAEDFVKPVVLNPNAQEFRMHSGLVAVDEDSLVFTLGTDNITQSEERKMWQEQKEQEEALAEESVLKIQTVFRRFSARRRVRETKAMERSDRESKMFEVLNEMQSLRKRILANASLIIRKDDADRSRYVALIDKLVGRQVRESKLMPATVLEREEYDARFPAMSQHWVWAKVCDRYDGSTRDPLLKSNAFLQVMWLLHCFWTSGLWTANPETLLHSPSQSTSELLRETPWG